MQCCKSWMMVDCYLLLQIWRFGAVLMTVLKPYLKRFSEVTNVDSQTKREAAGLKHRLDGITQSRFTDQVVCSHSY